MFQKLRNVTYLLPHLVGTARRYMRLPKTQLDGVDLSHLEQKQLDRIKYYIFLNRLIIEAFATLRNNKLTTEEIELGALLGAFTPIYDDLMDDQGFRHDELLTLSKGSNAMADVFIQMMDQIKLKHQDIASFNRYFEAAGVAQDESITIQRDLTVSIGKLRNIMNTKGGYFCLLFRSGMNHPYDASEEQVVYQLGGLTQYVNDIFDIRKDHLDGLMTLPIKMRSKAQLRADYQQAIKLFYKDFQRLPYDADNFKKCFLQIYLMLSRGLVALDQYEAIEKEKPFEIEKLSRAELVCDMEKIRNINKNIAYTVDLDSI